MQKSIMLLLGLFVLSAQAFDYERKYSGRFFEGEGEQVKSQCLAHAQQLAQTLNESSELKITVAEANCVKTQFVKGHRVVLVYFSDFSTKIENYEVDYKTPQDCQTSLPQVIRGFVDAEVFVADSSCRKVYKSKTQLSIAYVNKKYRSLGTYEVGPVFNDEISCIDYMQNLQDTMASNKIFSLASRCEAYSYGRDPKLFYRLNIDYFTKLGRSVHTISTKRVTNPSDCQVHKTDIFKTFGDNELDVLDVFCSGRVGEQRLSISYIDEIYSRVESYKGLEYTSKSACDNKLGSLKLIFEKQKKKVLFPYCQDTDSKTYRPTVFYLRPKYELPTPTPER